MDIKRHTVNDSLWAVLSRLMEVGYLKNFRLVGGTSLSLALGHRMSVDIDLFTDAEYGSVDFLEILENLKNDFSYVDHSDWVNESMGNSCFLGNSARDMIKVDLFYADAFVYPIILREGIRLSSLEEIAAMKLDVIARGGRKKDFWDIHALFDHFDLNSMLDFYSTRYPYHYSSQEILRHLMDFSQADTEPDPNCLNGKYWQLIKLDIEEKVNLLAL